MIMMMMMMMMMLYDDDDNGNDDNDDDDDDDDDDYTLVAVKLLAFRPELPKRPKSVVYTPRSRRRTFPFLFYGTLSPPGVVTLQEVSIS